VDIVAQVVSEQDGHAGQAITLADVLAADRWARDRAAELTGGRARRVVGAADRRGDSTG
jgi:hypothetical protein